MIVKCVRTKVQDFPLKSEEHLGYFRRRLRGKSAEQGYTDLVVGKEYVVYGIHETEGYPFYFVDLSEQYFEYYFRPGLCFEIVDSTVSKYWHCKHDVYVRKNGEEVFRNYFRVKEWNEDGFLNRLIDGNEKEKEVWLDIANKIEEEALEAKANNLDHRAFE